MQHAFVVRGTLKDRKTIELDEPMDQAEGPVEVTVRPVQTEKKIPLCESLSPEEFRKALDGLAIDDSNLPILSDEALRRESIYEEKL
jgi:hypothetical protein